MSNYANFVSDFPVRCDELLRVFGRSARLRNREVTLMLSIATPSILIPLERLTGPGTGEQAYWLGHPSRDWERFQEAKTKLEGVLETPFLGSALWPGASVGSWFCDELTDVSGPPDGWDQLKSPKAMGPDKKTKTVVRHIRNALAHGNIFTGGESEIGTIILLSQVAHRKYKFKYLAVSPADFRTFLGHWLEFLRDLRLPTIVVPEFADAAA